MSTRRVGIGIIGCGNISPKYLTAMPRFEVLEVRGIADQRAELATQRAAEFGVPARSVDALLADPSVEIVLNLTTPMSHAEVGQRVIAAGKHLYSEKPLGTSFAEGSALVAAAKERGVRLGAAPDTFLGGSHQEARSLIDSGRLGRVLGATVAFASSGHESWHPGADFYYERGGGPVFDMGPYYSRCSSTSWVRCRASAP